MKQYLLILPLLLQPEICISNDQNNGSEDIIVTHAGSTEKLRFIMLKLNSALNKNKHSDIHQDQVLSDNIDDLLTVIDDLLRNTEQMKTDTPDFDLDMGELKTFRSMVNQLYIDVLELKQVTNDAEYYPVETAYQRLDQTCAACHDLFRNP